MEPISSSAPLIPQPPTPTTQILNFPLRFFGSKSESLYAMTNRLINGGNAPTHYHFVPQKELDAKDAREFIHYATLTHIVQSKLIHLAAEVGFEIVNPDDIGINLTGIPGSVEANHQRFFDKTTGFKMMVFTKQNEVVVAFGPAASYENEVSGFEAFRTGSSVWCCGVMANLAGVIPLIYIQAEALFRVMTQSPFFQDKAITLVGHSIGGSLASYISLKHRVRAIAFNTLAIGVGIQKDVGEENLAQAERYLTHLSVAGDPPSDFPGLHYVDRCVSLAGIKTPGNFGNHYRIPFASWSPDRTHNDYLQALLELIRKSPNT